MVGSSEILFTVNNDKLSITAGTEISTNYALTILVDEVDETVSSKFSIEYIEQLLSFDKIDKVVEFKMGDNYPLLYLIEDNIMGVKVNGLIAPRLEVED